MHPTLPELLTGDDALYRVCAQLTALAAHRGEREAALRPHLLVGPGVQVVGVDGEQLLHPGAALALDAELPQAAHLRHLCLAPLAVESRARVALMQATEVYELAVTEDLRAATHAVAAALDRPAPARRGVFALLRAPQRPAAAALDALREVAARTPLVLLRAATPPKPGSEYVGSASWVD